MTNACCLPGVRRVCAIAMALTLLSAITAASALASTSAQRTTITSASSSTGGCTGLAAPRSPTNPLGLAKAPGADPLHGARFFVDGPTHGAAAGEIARLLGIDSNVPVGQYLSAFPDDEPWQTFLGMTVDPKLASVSASFRRKVELLEKIAKEPETQLVSSNSDGGSPAGISAFVTKILCHNLTADPGSVPVLSTYLMHPVLGGCASTGQIDAYMPLFERRVNAMVAATGTQPVVYLLELDVVGSSSCMAKKGSLPAWERMLRYEVDKVATLEHAVVYIEGGYSDSNNPRYAANVLNAADIRRARGFFTNDTHNNWTISEVRYGQQVSRLTGGSHFIIDTAQNGRGPKLNPHPATQGIEDLCNPPGLGLGPLPTTNTTFPKVDALLWTHTPGNSSGPCNGGPPSGSFWPARAISLAANANQRYGPSYPSRPY